MPTQASYNKPDNWVQRNQLGLEEVKKCIHEVSQDTSFNLELTYNRDWGEFNAESIVWHEPILDRYWDVLESEIYRRKQLGGVTEDIKRIYISNVEITSERLAALVAVLLSGRATNSSTFIKFDNTNLCAEGIRSLSKLVEASSMLYRLYLYHNRIDNMDLARCLSRSLKSHTCINHLHLAHCDLGSSPEILSVILQSEVKSIHLSNNNIDSLGAVMIAEYLGSDPPIGNINLDHNQLNDHDAELISQALKRNTNLKIINLRSNNITSIGVKALLNSVFDSSSLNAISESNHTLERMFMFYSHNDRLQDCIDKLLHLDRTQKIFLALQDKDCLLKYLANVPVELIPEVLEFTRWVDDQPLNKHLNIFYSTMRWWNMPMLYSYFNCVKSDTKRKRDV
jgi:hypothetical protein